MPFMKLWDPMLLAGASLSRRSITSEQGRICCTKGEEETSGKKAARLKGSQKLKDNNGACTLRSW